tara:strand:- start:797 stop:928 length:132 start_codon:yes stop_codon:yes gene_type:complete
MINVIVGAMIYVLFRKAGIIGQDGGGDGKATESSGVMDAELAG